MQGSPDKQYADGCIVLRTLQIQVLLEAIQSGLSYGVSILTDISQHVSHNAIMLAIVVSQYGTYSILLTR
jgi:hypothetical protein